MISVIIPTRNRAELLDCALRSITLQTLPRSDYEVLVVDNGSTDGTAQVVAAHKSVHVNLGSVYAPKPGLHAARHEGMTVSKGEILVFADDDIEAQPTWLQTVSQCFSDSCVAMVGGNNYPKFMVAPPWWIRNLWNRNRWFGYKAIPALSVLEFLWGRHEISPYWVWGCNFAIRKDVLLAAGGFHPDGMPQDLIRFRGDGETHVSRFVADSGMKCVFHPGASVYHKVPASRMTYQYFYQRGYNQGVSDSYTVLRDAKFQVNDGPSFCRMAWHKSRQLLREDVDRFFLCKDACRALQSYKIGHHNGYAYHQKMYQEDANVREWVHMERYY